MVVEAYWKTVKHDYLHRSNRPRVDLVVWILIRRVIRDSVTVHMAKEEVFPNSADITIPHGFGINFTTSKSHSLQQGESDPFRFTCA